MEPPPLDPAPLDPAHAAWLAAIPAAAIAIAAMLLLGPPLGDLMPPSTLRVWRELAAFVQPEPTEQARFLILLSAPLLLAGATLLLVRRPPAALARRAPATAAGVELAAVLLILACFAVQRTQDGQEPVDPGPYPYFSVAALVAAVALGCAIAALARSSRARERWAAWAAAAESPTGRRAVAAVAVAAIVVTLLPAISTDRSIITAHEQVSFHLSFIYDEAAAVLDGRSPLHDFATQYGSLLPYALAGAMALLGTSVGVFTVLLTLLGGASLLALFAVLRRLSRSSLAGLLLFLPLLATSAYRLRGDAVTRFSLVNYFGVLPLRYAGPFVLAWLVVRHLDGARPRRIWPLFLLGGLVAVNNPDFGVAALGATVAALAWGEPRAREWRAAAEALLGVAAALALVTALLLARTGSPPRFSLLFDYAEVFTRAGFGMFPIKPLIGLHTVLLLTYVAAIGLATVHALRGAADRAMTGMLAWCGTFGLGAGAYYVARSRSEQLFYMFPAWALALAVLTIVAVRWLAATRRRPTPIVLACLVGFGLLVCSLVQTPAPWSQVERIAQKGEPIYREPAGQAFVAEHTQRGERVVILSALGHRMAYNLGLSDVEMYTGDRSIQTLDQFERSLRALQRAGGEKVFLWWERTPNQAIEILSRAGYRRAAQEATDSLQLWVAR